MGATGHPPRRGTRTLILHGSNDPLLSVVPISEESRSLPGAVGRLSNVYLMIIFMSVSRMREVEREGGRALPSPRSRSMPVCMVRTRRMSMSVPAYYFECTTSLCPLCRVRQAAKSSGRRRRNSPGRPLITLAKLPGIFYTLICIWDL